MLSSGRTGFSTDFDGLTVAATSRIALAVTTPSCRKSSSLGTGIEPQQSLSGKSTPSTKAQDPFSRCRNKAASGTPWQCSRRGPGRSVTLEAMGSVQVPELAGTAICPDHQQEPGRPGLNLRKENEYAYLQNGSSSIRRNGINGPDRLRKEL